MSDMEMSSLLLFGMSVLALSGHIKAEETNYISSEHKLMSDLMEGYCPDVRPVKDPSDAVKVQLGMTLVHVDGLDENRQILYLNSWLRFVYLTFT